MIKDRDSKQSIQVTIRVRPLSDKQQLQDSRTCVKIDSESHSLHMIGNSDVKKFTFDSICFNQSQQEIFNKVGKKCTLDCLEGYNCTIFAYGQTGAGKTYTMMGVNYQHQRYYELRGLIPRTLEYLFQCIENQRQNGVNFIIKCSFLQIYNQQIMDLLNSNNTNLNLREDTRKGVYVEGITEENITRSQEAIKILQKGSKSRHVGSTFYNEASSRSHSVFTMTIQSKYSKNGVLNTKSRQFNFIDLAGSERTKQSTGERLKQGCNINKSLMNLAAVINALSEVSQGKSQHVNYRNSKLTFLLKDSLGGNSKTNLIANISPSLIFYQESISTLGFARRAKLIKREKASINEDSTGNLQSMKNEIKRLKQQVIALMGKLQNNQSLTTNPSQKSTNSDKIATIMHQYVSEQIDKQTKLELELLKLIERNQHLQKGIQKYNACNIHLRMVKDIYEDKIKRLKNVEKKLSQEVTELNKNDQKSKDIIEYFQSQRQSLIKQIQQLRKDSDSAKYIKELLKEARSFKAEQQDENLKDILLRNNDFLLSIQNKLSEINPQKVDVEFTSDFEKKVSEIQIQFHKKQQEYHQRIEQLQDEAQEFKIRNDQNEKLLEQAISLQMTLQQKIMNHKQEIQQMEQCLKATKSNQIQLENKLKDKQNKLKQKEIEYNEAVQNKNIEISLCKKQIEQLKNKLLNEQQNHNIIKQEFLNLEDQKYKVDKHLTQAQEEIKIQKNDIVKLQMEIKFLKEQVEQLKERQITEQQIYQNKILQANNQKSILKSKIGELQINFEKLMAQQQKVTCHLNVEIGNKDSLLKQFEIKQNEMQKKLQKMKKDSIQKQNSFEVQISRKEQKINQLITLINEKQENGNQISQNFNKIKIDLINVTAQKDSLESNLNNMIRQNQQANARFNQSYQQWEKQKIEKSKLYQNLNQQYQSKKKQLFQISDILAKQNRKLTQAGQQNNSLVQKLALATHQNDSYKSRQKQHKLALMQIKNELFISQKNSALEIQTLKDQLHSKQTHLEQIEKDQQKNKIKYEKNIEELQTQIQKNQELYKNLEESLKRTMEMHSNNKDKKINELKQTMNEKEQEIKSISQQNQKLIRDMQLTKAENVAKYKESEQFKYAINQLKSQIESLKFEIQQINIKYEKQFQQSQISHNIQLDERNQQIQNLLQEMKLLKQKNQEIQSKNKSLTSEIEESKSKTLNLFNENKKNLQMTFCYQTKVKEMQQKVKQLENGLQMKVKQIQQQKLKMKHLQLLIEQKQQKDIAIQQKIANQQSKIQKINQQYSSILKSYEQLKANNIQVTQTLKQNEVNQTQMSNQIKVLKQQLSILTNQNETQAGIISIKDQKCQQFLTVINELQSKLIQAKNSILVVENSKEQQIQILNSKLEKYESNQNTVLSELSVLNQQKQVLIKSAKENEIKVGVIMTENQNLILNNKRLIEQNEKIEIQIEALIVKNRNEEAKVMMYEKKVQQLSDINQQINQKLKNVNQQLLKIYLSINQKMQEISMNEAIINRLNIEINRLNQQINKYNSTANQQTSKLMQQNKNLCFELMNTNKRFKEHEIQISASKEKLLLFEKVHYELNNKIQQLLDVKSKYDVQNAEIDKLKHQLSEQQSFKERIYNELCREKQTNNHFKMIIQNAESQKQQLQVQLEEKDTIYRKLLEKIAKNQNQSKRLINSEHYLKTIQLLQKTRAENLQLRRDKDDLKKAVQKLQEQVGQKIEQVKEVQKRSQSYCISMHKRLEQIQNDYLQLEKNQQKLLKQKKAMEKYLNQMQTLQNEIKNNKRINDRINYRNDDLETKLKKANSDYLQLQEEFQSLKKKSLTNVSVDENIGLINKLKAELAKLKAEKAILSDNLQKEKEEKIKLKSQMRYGKQTGETNYKIQLEKKLNQNKNLQELIFQITSYLKISIVEPKTKLEAIRTVIIGTIKDRNNQILILKDKIKQYEQNQRQPANKYDSLLKGDSKVLTSVNKNYKQLEENTQKHQKQRDSSVLNNGNYQRQRQLESVYSKFHPSNINNMTNRSKP